jgi:predicted metal-dependent phosphotriesterase family hydrolase
MDSKPEDSERKINTVLGMLPKSYFFEKGKGILGYEHIVQNLSKEANELDDHSYLFGAQIELKYLSLIMKNPFSNLQNTILDDEPAILAHEVEQIRDHACGIVDVSNNMKSQNGLKLQKISKLSKIDIICGCSADTSLISEDKTLETNIQLITNEMDFIICHGIDDVRPGFLGELIIPDETLSQENHIILKSFCILNEKHGIPIYVTLKKPSSNLFLEIKRLLESYNVSPSSALITLSENPLGSTFESLLLTMGFNVNIPTYWCQYTPFSSELLGLIINFLGFALAAEQESKIKEENKEQDISNAFLTKVIISNGFNFKTQLTTYGGMGYCNLYEFYYNSIKQGLLEKGFDKQAVLNALNRVFAQNVLDLLCWAKEKEEIIAPVEQVPCQICGKTGEKEMFFQKHHFWYCSTKCIGKHRAQGFKP